MTLKYSTPSLNEPAVEDILEELARLGDEAGSDPEEVGDDYDRTVTIRLPREAQDEYAMSSIEVSVHLLLTWLAAENSPDVDRLLALRDDFYSGGDEFDHGYMIGEPTMLSPSMEELAMRRVARASVQGARVEKRQEIELADQERVARESEAWLPFVEERRALEQEKAQRVNRWEELHAAWDKFVIERESWGDDRAEREAVTRAALEASEAQLKLEGLFWSGQWAELTDRVHRAANLKSAAA